MKPLLFSMFQYFNNNLLGGGLGYFFWWVCAARDSKLAPRSGKNFP